MLGTLKNKHKNIFHDKYRVQKIKQGNPHIEAGCKGKCLKSYICRRVTTDFEDARRYKALYATKQ